MPVRKTINIKLEDDGEVMPPEVVAGSSNYVDTMDSFVTLRVRKI